MQEKDVKNKENNKENDKEKAYVYLLRCSDNSLYTGITTDLSRRISEHAERKGQGAKYTRSHPVVGIGAAFLTPDLSVAAKYEYRIKRLSKEKKEALVRDPESIQKLLEELYLTFPVKPVARKNLPKFPIVFSDE